MLVSVLTEHRIEKVSISVDRTVQVTPSTTNLDVRFVQVPGNSCAATALGSKPVADHRCKPKLPCPYGFVTDFESTVKKWLCDVTESELVSQAPKYRE